MTDPKTPARDDENAEATSHFESSESPSDGGLPRYPAVDPAEDDAAGADSTNETRAETTAETPAEASTEARADVPAEPRAEVPAEPARAPEDEPAAAEPAAAEPARADPTPAEPARASEVEPEPAAPARPWSASRSDADPVDSPAASSPDSTPQAAPAPTVPPLAEPTAAPATTSTGTLHDDSALRAAEAARAGEVSAPALAPRRDDESSDAAAAGAPADSNDTGDVGDTRLVAPNAARSSTAWTPPPAPASPTESPAPTVATPTPYAPPTQATQVLSQGSPAAPPTSSTPISRSGTSPVDSLGFSNGIAGGDDGFTPEELAQRRAFRDEMSFRQKQEFAGINFGAGFFGWLAAVGLSGILYLIAGGIALALGLSSLSKATGSTLSDRVTSLMNTYDSSTQQITALVVFLVILFLSYFVGGFVASRMARFSGLKQGLAVWLWGLIVSLLVAVVLVVIASQNSSSTSGMNFSTTDLTSVPTLIGAGLVVVLSIGGALLGGLAGQAYHRRVDRFGFDEV